MTFNEWKNTDEYRRLILEPFGDFGYVEAIAETAFVAAQKNQTLDTKSKERA